METPPTMRRDTGSQTFTKSKKIKKDGSISRSALLDITNDSPIVGLATGSLSEKTLSSSLVKNRVRAVKNTARSAEGLLSGQDETFLQKVEEEVGFVNNKISLRDLAAPAPQVQILEENGAKNVPVEVAEVVKPKETLNPEECLFNRALLFNSPSKSEITDNTSTISSSLTYQGSETEKSPENDRSSAWSLQVNVSVQDEDEEAEEIEEYEEEEEFEEYEDDIEEDYDDESFDELGEGLSRMSVHEFNEKHTRFVYNSDDEMEVKEEVGTNVSPNVVVLKGLPVPEGKHLRFHDEEDQE